MFSAMIRDARARQPGRLKSEANMRMLLRLSLGLTIMTVSGSALAHHSFAGKFDGSRALHLQGVVDRVERVNPHTFIYLNVRTETGDFEQWALEGPSAFQLPRRGWDEQQMVKAGDAIGVCGYVSTSVARMLSAAVLTLPSGEPRIFSNYRQGKCGLDH